MFSTDNRLEISVSILLLVQDLPLMVRWVLSGKYRITLVKLQYHGVKIHMLMLNMGRTVGFHIGLCPTSHSLCLVIIFEDLLMLLLFTTEFYFRLDADFLQSFF